MNALGRLAIGGAGFGALAWMAVNGWLPDTPTQHEERMQCEMFQMQGGGMSNRPMSAGDAEALCDKAMQMEKAADFAKQQ
jgi:hypothetical protein